MDLQEIERLAGLGLSKKHIAILMGLTSREVDKLEYLFPEVSISIDRGRSSSLSRLTQKLIDLANNGDDLKAIQAALVLVGGEEYRTDKPTTSITNNTVIALPSPSEALEILKNDPAILDGELVDHNLITGVNQK
jgi:hypothetical protein